MEMEFFVQPGTDEEWHERWIETRMAWYLDLGAPENLRLLEHPGQLSHYSKRHRTTSSTGFAYRQRVG